MKHEPIIAAIGWTLILWASFAWSQGQTESSASAITPTQASEQSPPQRIHVSESAFQKMIVSRVNPTFTKEERKEQKEKRIQGPVSMRVIIATTGDVSEVTLIKGNPFLARPAIEAVKQWKFRAPTLKGVPVEVEATIILNFTLSGG
jgi:periplasmic protein TonB